MGWKRRAALCLHSRQPDFLKILVVVGALCVLGLHSSAFAAQEVEAVQNLPSDLTTLSLEELMNIEITSVSKKPESISEAPASVFVIPREDIRRYGYRNLSEALRRVIGLYVSSDRNYEYLGVRGYARPGDYNTRILLLIDGHRINDPIYDMALIGEDLPLDIESIERIEVAKGPGSALWGTNALLAVVNLIASKGSDINGSRGTAEYGGHDRTKGFVEYGKASGGGVEVAASFSALSSDGQKRIYFPEFDDPSTNNGVAEGIDGENAVRGYLSASYKGFKFLFNKGRRRKTIPTASYSTVFNNGGTFSIDERTFAELSYEKAVSRRRSGELLLRIYHDESDYHGDFIYDYDTPPLTVNKDHGQSKWWGGEIRYSQDIFSRLSTTFGFEYLSVYKMLQENHDAEPYFHQYANISSSFDLRSYYLQTDLDLLSSLRLVTGVRLDDYSTFGKAWSPRAALIHSPSSTTRLKLLYGKAFRAPNDYERSYYDPTSGMLANPALKPETIKTYELVWEQEVGRQCRLVASVFHFSLGNIITQITTPTDEMQFQNLGAAVSRGVEIQLESRSHSGLTGYLGLTALRATDSDTGARLSNSPSYLAAAGVSIPVKSGKLYITPEIQYVGSRKTLSANKIPAAAVVNLTLGTERFSSNTDFSFSVYNLFDQDVFVPGSAEHVQDRIPQDGRTFRLQLTHRF